MSLSTRAMATVNTRSSLALTTPLSSSSTPDIKIPRFIYGTAWKKEQTAELVYQALKAKFRGIDTAAQPRHYQEALVGEGIRRAIMEGFVERKELYLQTKYTPPSGQDPLNMPYNSAQPISEQIHSSIASSLSHFAFPGNRAPYIDCLVLHSPFAELGLTHQAWRTLESYVSSGQIRSLGISNVTLDVLQSLVEEMTIKPSIVQNRFHPGTAWEVSLRQYCEVQGIIFQSFWTLTGNPQLMGSDLVSVVATELGKEKIVDPKQIALYSLVLSLGNLSVLNGTTNRERMASDLQSLTFMENLIQGPWKEEWNTWMQEFKGLIGEA